MSDEKEKKRPDNDDQHRVDWLLETGINFKDRVVLLTGDIEDGSFNLIDAALSEMERDSKRGVTIRINCPGGSVYEALAIVGRMQASRCYITTEGYGQIMSSASLVLAAGSKRRMSKYAFFMHHCSSYSTGGKHTEVLAQVAQFEREERIWSDWMSKFSNQSADFWYNSGSLSDLYLTAAECLSMGVIDEII